MKEILQKIHLRLIGIPGKTKKCIQKPQKRTKSQRLTVFTFKDLAECSQDNKLAQTKETAIGHVPKEEVNCAIFIFPERYKVALLLFTYVMLGNLSCTQSNR